MQGPHRTILTYFYGEVDADGDCPQLEVGEVTCVPRVGERVWIEPTGQFWDVESVAWTPDRRCFEKDEYGNGPSNTITWVAVNLNPAKKTRTPKMT